MAEIKKRKKIYINSIKLIFQNILSLTVGQGMLLFLFVFVLTPIISKIYHLALKVTGFSYVTIDNIGRFLLNPISIIMLALLFIVIGLFLLLEIFYLIIFFSMLENNKKFSLLQVFKYALYKLVFCIRKGNLKLLPAAFITMAVFNLPLFIFVLNRIRLFRFFTDEIPDKLLLLLIGAITIILIGIFLFRKLFVFHYYMVEDEAYKDAIGYSKRLKENKTLPTFLYFLGWNLILVGIEIILYLFTMAVTGFFVSGIFDRTLAIATFISINDSINQYLMLIIFFISTIGNFALYTHLFYHYKLAANVKGILKDIPNIIIFTEKEGNAKSYKKILKTTLLLLIVINFYFFFNIVRNGSPLDYMNLDMIRVTSHRGFSYSVPENTLPAIEKAIEEQADYVEVDVRVTKDGELILLHDNNLKRTTGLNKKVWDINYAEIALLDAGSWMNQSFIGTKIPTLREVFESSKGKVLLNLDLKYRNASEGLEEKVVALIEEYEMEWQCVISSTSLTCIENIKKLNPNIRTGYITYQLYSGLSRKESIDFFSMKSNLVSKSVVREIHKNGKELHVWTVNAKTELERLKRLGVDNIITDNPAFAKEVLYQAGSDQYLLTLLKIIME
ncbi:glycerophosphoryl diester phosphodiesterase [Anaerocolumna cellulosilytica]|uniref:Glycerophosphoryl diester phosphodiesterase n=1 Tax=Anaerocolumna cellulosilytica TaxID=433286 RepID=A0A6S6QSC0_9FIRM|nr:glycerophosphodiester phosphodiesterase [Anaerocolumna cellulosilytica]MBB5196164.1 glycerophosphoryl diester phosphodiesterase [Anaerocolumna cellulosilytica]BCJ92516.1 glycerophosphoryl diester phosphodiesterase [Anaerocolumna cellulosilytica]